MEEPSFRIPTDRRRKFAGKRALNHDYRSRRNYHIVLNKNVGVDDFSHIAGIVGSHDNKPHIINHPNGEIISEALKIFKTKFPHVNILRRAIMPDHLHLALFVKSQSQLTLGQMIAEFKRDCSRIYESLGNPEGVRLFTEGFYDTIVWRRGQLDRILAYISDNPRRHLLRRGNPGWFRRFRVMIDGGCYEAFGNWDLLWEPVICAVKVSSRYSEEELRGKKIQWVKTVENDGVLASPFIAEGEKRVRDWAADNGGALIVLTAEPFGERYKPAGRMFEVCAEGRLLEIYVPPADEREWEYLRANKKPARSACERMNALAERIASGIAGILP